MLRPWILSVLLLAPIVVASSSSSKTRGSSISWLHEVRSLFRDCPLRGTANLGLANALADCARSRTLLVIDQILDDDVVPIVEGLRLVKFANSSGTNGNNSNNENDDTDDPPENSAPSIR